MSVKEKEDRKELEDLALQYLSKHDKIADSLEFLTTYSKQAEHERFASVLQSLHSANYIIATPIDHLDHILTAEGNEYTNKGTPEGQLLQALRSGPQSNNSLESLLGKDVFTIAKAQAMKNKWITINKETSEYSLKEGMNINDEVKEQLLQIQRGESDKIDAKILTELKKRKMIVPSTRKTYSVIKGSNFASERKALATDLTFDLLRSGEWNTAEYKQYNWNALGAELHAGCLHPLMKVRAQFRSILLEMGFEEMPTNNYIESSFWNFDALFQPQQHPARDSHDTFFLTSPETCLALPREDYVSRVQQMHEIGGDGSIGYRYDWKIAEARKNILRTHTTAVSSRMLYTLAQSIQHHNNGIFIPKKYFSIDRVFRNETLDATHLAEFHQVEGLIADIHLTLGDLIGIIATFFQRIGITDIKFKPAYNPYTEPSMEIFGYSNELKKWIEVGNSGIFRPEMLRPMGFSEDVTVIAWGLSLERPTMIKYGIKNIRDLFGPKVKLDLIQSNPIARFDD